MTNKQQFLADWKNVDLNELGLSKSVWFKGLTEEAKKRIMKEYGFKSEEEAEQEYFFVGSDIEEEDIEDWDEYSEEWFEDNFYNDIAYLLEKVFKRDYPYFLCHSVRGDWMGNSSYQFYSKDEVENGGFIESDYHNSTYIVDYYKGKVLELREHHHDVPLGHPVYLIGLTEDQYSELWYYHQNYERMKIKEFAESVI